MTKAERDELILSQRPMVTEVARVWERKCKRAVPAEELENEAWLGVIDATRRYDGIRPFGPYAKRRAIGQMQDYLRGLDPVSRTERGRLRARGITGSITISLDAKLARTRDRDRDESVFGDTIPFQPNQEPELADRERKEILDALIENSGLTPIQLGVIRRMLDGRACQDISREDGNSVGAAAQAWLGARLKMRDCAERMFHAQ